MRELELDYINSQIPLMKGAFKCFIAWLLYDVFCIIPYVIVCVSLHKIFYTTFITTCILLAIIEMFVFLKFVNRTWELKQLKRWLERYLKEHHDDDKSISQMDASQYGSDNWQKLYYIDDDE